jgi:hypothetical protein
MYPPEFMEALAGLIYVFPPVVGLAPDPAGFPPPRRLVTTRVRRRLQHGKYRASGLAALTKTSGVGRSILLPIGPAGWPVLLDKIGTDNRGGNCLQGRNLRLRTNGFFPIHPPPSVRLQARSPARRSKFASEGLFAPD